MRNVDAAADVDVDATADADVDADADADVDDCAAAGCRGGTGCSVIRSPEPCISLCGGIALTWIGTLYISMSVGKTALGGGPLYFGGILMIGGALALPLLSVGSRVIGSVRSRAIGIILGTVSKTGGCLGGTGGGLGCCLKPPIGGGVGGCCEVEGTAGGGSGVCCEVEGTAGGCCGGCSEIEGTAGGCLGGCGEIEGTAGGGLKR